LRIVGFRPSFFKVLHGREFFLAGMNSPSTLDRDWDAPQVEATINGPGWTGPFVAPVLNLLPQFFAPATFRLRN
jgi:hypothetical protein